MISSFSFTLLTRRISISRWFLIVASAIFLIVGCAPTSLNESDVPIKAIYLVQGEGQLSQEDLKSHPEVIVTDSFEEFKELAHSKVALWVDINAVAWIELDWLGKSPQRHYPVVLIGNGDEMCSFFESMPYFAFSIPCCLDCSSYPPGYSVNIQTDMSQGHMQGYEKTPTVKDILDITNPLLDKVK